MLCQKIIITMIGLETAASTNISLWSNVWSYEDESSWPGEYCQQGGRRQSPIDIRTSQVTLDYKSQFIKYGGLKFVGYDKVLLTGVNNGHTVQFSTDGEKGMHPSLTGGPLGHVYRMEQLHFHWLSEHSVDGHKYPMEIHFVHIRSDLTVQEALAERDGLAIVSVFCNVKSDLDDAQFERTQEFMQHVPQLLATGDRVSGVLLDVTSLLSSNLYSYYTYAGSLTSPQCNEVVIWIIFEMPINISNAQYQLFSKANSGRQNFRRLQPVRWHKVYSPPPKSMWSTPYLISVFSDVFRTVSDFVRNVTMYVRKAVTSKRS